MAGGVRNVTYRRIVTPRGDETMQCRARLRARDVFESPVETIVSIVGDRVYNEITVEISRRTARNLLGTINGGSLSSPRVTFATFLSQYVSRRIRCYWRGMNADDVRIGCVGGQPCSSGGG